MPRRYDRYGFLTMDLDDAARRVEHVLGTSLEQRESDYWGVYYCRRTGSERSLMLYKAHEQRDRPYRLILDVNNTENMDDIRTRLTKEHSEPAFLGTKLLPDRTDDEPVLDAIERAVLTLVEQGRGAFGWHELEVRLGMIELPRRDYNVLTVLQGLKTRGLVAEVPRGKWRLVWDPKGGADLDTLIDALRAGPREMLARYKPLIEDPAAFDSALWQLIADRPDAGDAIAFGVVQVPEPLRGELAKALWTSQNVGFRRGLYTMLAPARLDVEGATWQALEGDTWATCIAAGLADEDSTVRRHAAAMVFGTRLGEAFADALVGNVRRADTSEQIAILLALGSARSAASWTVLQHAAAGADVRLTTAARRALAARPDRDNLPRIPLPTQGYWPTLREKLRATLDSDLSLLARSERSVAKLLDRPAAWPRAFGSLGETAFRCLLSAGPEVVRSHLRLHPLLEKLLEGDGGPPARVASVELMAVINYVAVARCVGHPLPAATAWLEARWFPQVAGAAPTYEAPRRACAFAATAIGAPGSVSAFHDAGPLTPRATTQPIVPMNTFGFARHLAECALGGGGPDAVDEPWQGYLRVFPIALQADGASWIDLFWAATSILRFQRRAPTDLATWLPELVAALD